MAHEPISPDPVSNWRAGDLPAYLSNGLVGLRIRHIPYINGVATLSGFDGIDPAQAVETFARAPYPLSGDVRVDGKSLDYAPDRVRFVDQRYDFSTGELTSRSGSSRTVWRSMSRSSRSAAAPTRR
jgi:protein-glucosylgalactosylhydroxylysine glucosidase